MIKNLKLRYSFFSFFGLLAVVSLEAPVLASYTKQNQEYFINEIDLLWKEDQPGYSIFMERVENRLPKYESLFQDAAKGLEVHWTLIAAISYQESHWNPKAISNTGVRGMMMLTLPTAKSLGVDNRLDPVQSINGGASYIAKLIDEINFGTSTGDTISIALAAYNLGVGNINRYLEEIQINLNKENFEITWDDLSSFLTEEVNHNELIGNSTNYKRGIQAVDYVTRVKDYYYLILGLGCN